METETKYLSKCASKQTCTSISGRGEGALLLRSSELFASLSSSECYEIFERARPRNFERTEMLFMQGQPFRHLILVESGCVKLTRLCPNGSEVILGLRGPNEAMDLPAGPSFGTHTYAAQALIPCRTLIWEWSLMERLMATVPNFSRNVCCILTRQLHELQGSYHELSTESVARRVACALLRMAKQFGTPTARGTEILVSRQELAQMTGTTLFTVSRLISKWGRLGLILPRREAVLMLDPERLERLSAFHQSLDEDVFSLAARTQVGLSSITSGMSRRVSSLC